MTRWLSLLGVIALAGCSTCETPSYFRQPDSTEEWNTNYLLDADPNTVSVADLVSRAATLDQRYWQYSQVDGVVWQALRSDASLAEPDRYSTGGDSALFTGQALAAFSFEYGVTRSTAALQHVRESLRGLYILTHSSGTPGVVQRNAFPAATAELVGFEHWGRNPLFVHTGPAFPDPFGGPTIPSHVYYTRGTKDQLTGLVLGLAAVWSVTDPSRVDPAQTAEVAQIRAVAKQTAEDIYAHLKAYDWWIRDENGANDTNADYVDQILRACVLGLIVHMGDAGLQVEYDETYADFIDLSNTLAYGDQFNNYQQYYGHNLRASRALAIWLLEGPDSPKGQQIATYVSNNLWRFTQGHKNAWFAFIRGVTAPEDGAAIAEGVYSLKSLSLKPTRLWSSPYHGQEHTPNIAEALVCHRNFVLDPHLRKPAGYSTWQKEPWDVGSEMDWDKEGLFEMSGIDYLLAYWLARYRGLF